MVGICFDQLTGPRKYVCCKLVKCINILTGIIDMKAETKMVVICLYEGKGLCSIKLDYHKIC